MPKEKTSKTSPRTGATRTRSRKSVIQRGEVAEFFRKRTQLVGFSMELHKHTQYVAEFSDNSLDAIETYYWKQIRKDKTKAGQPIILPGPPKEVPYSRLPPPPTKIGKGSWTASTISARVKRLVAPIRNLINHEPVMLINLQELEKPDILPDEVDGRNLQMYSFEALDTGIGMTRRDLQQFGLYLASSKSQQLRQTRGSQGFGASSAFSDAQNTTGRPIIVATRYPSERQGHVSVFFTTGKNQKEYVLTETKAPLSFTHGTYLQLFYLNIQYRRSYADEYIRQTSFLNSHVNIIFIDPYGKIHLYPRRVSEFVKEPSYAMPHPTSTSIGDFQDQIRDTKHTRLEDFLLKSYCRMSQKRAERIIKSAKMPKGVKRLRIGTRPKRLTLDQIKALYASFIAEKYYAPPTETVVPVGEEVIRKTLKEIFKAEFVEATSRPPTSSKGLAFAVEVAAVYDPDLSSQSGAGVLFRFVNRTPKLRDNSDCAIWKAAASVNWRAYKVDAGANRLPTGPFRLFANVAGPFVHLIFKAQSKQALAEDDILIRELKLGFEEVGRKLRRHIAQVLQRRERARRADTLLRYSRKVAQSIIAIQKSDTTISQKQLTQLPQRLEAIIIKQAGVKPSDDIDQPSGSTEEGEVTAE
ncbi:MAG: DNA topoisomerase VI subunit B [Promethearchaeota archaeon]